jgi:hypothetical protein
MLRSCGTSQHQRNEVLALCWNMTGCLHATLPCAPYRGTRVHGCPTYQASLHAVRSSICRCHIIRCIPDKCVCLSMQTSSLLRRFTSISHETTVLMAQVNQRFTTSIGELYDVPITPRHARNDHNIMFAHDHLQNQHSKDVSVGFSETSAYPYFMFGSNRMVFMIVSLLLISWSFCWLYLGANWYAQVSVASVPYTCQPVSTIFVMHAKGAALD